MAPLFKNNNTKVNLPVNCFHIEFRTPAKFNVAH